MRKSHIITLFGGGNSNSNILSMVIFSFKCELIVKNFYSSHVIQKMYTKFKKSIDCFFTETKRLTSRLKFNFVIHRLVETIKFWGCQKSTLKLSLSASRVDKKSIFEAKKSIK